ncbi:MAG: hypothetical protein HOO93_17500 [Methyloglobulus sp.]|nr:hypothetical protein [Methyloglobulus sp.]
MHIPEFWIPARGASSYLFAALDLQGCGECWQPYGTVAAPPSLAVVHAGMTVFKLGNSVSPSNLRTNGKI